MNNLVRVFCMLIVFFSCTKKDFVNTGNNETTVKSSLWVPYDIDELIYADKIKFLVASYLKEMQAKDESFLRAFSDHLTYPDNSSKELLYIRDYGVFIYQGRNFKEQLEHHFREDATKLAIIRSIEDRLPNLVIKLPLWAKEVLNSANFQLNYQPVACVSLSAQNASKALAKSSEQFNTIGGGLTYGFGSLPIQVAESERLVPVEHASSITFFGQDFFQEHFPFLANCNDFNFSDYQEYSNADYRFIDKYGLRDDLRSGSICHESWDMETELGVPCDSVYMRDCIDEKNVIEGLKFTSAQDLIAMDNQPGGEDNFSVNLKFVVASMCDDLSQPSFCPPNTWNLVFNMGSNEIYDFQTFNGTPDKWSDVIFAVPNPVGEYLYMKAFPKYYDIPFNASQEQIYSQVRFLHLTPNSTWDGNVYGDAISYQVFERDFVTVDQTFNYTKTVTNTTKVSTKLQSSEQFTSGLDFSSAITRSTSTEYVLNADKDVELGEMIINYYTPNYSLPGGSYGYYTSTGAISFHLAFY